MDKDVLAMFLDVLGWEQDGRGKTFICLATGERKTFKSWKAVEEFAEKIYKEC